MLDALCGGVCVMAYGGACAGDLVGGDRGSDAAAAEDDASVCLPAADGPGDGGGEIGIVVIGIELVCAEVDYLVSEALDHLDDVIFEGQAGVVCADGDFHFCHYCPGCSSRVFDLVRILSAVKPNFSMLTPPGAEAPKPFIAMMSPSRPT